MKAKSCQISLLFLLLLVFSSLAHADTNIVNIYDASGNLVTGDGNYYEYNDANQLVRVRQGDLNGAVIAEYFYDYSGQRVKKIENGVTTYYVGAHFEKQVGGADAGNSKYYFADGERVAKKDPAGNVYYYHSDHLGGVIAVTDSAGTVVAKTEYLPFGDVKQGSTGNEKYSYTGKEKDKTDLYYFESRYNSPMFRHFTQADTIEPDISDPQDLNRYSYVGNNPLSYVDPSGHKKKKRHLSEREQRALSLGKNPDKYKKWAGKLSDREYKRLLKSHLKHEAEEKLEKLQSSLAKSSTSGNVKEDASHINVDFKNTYISQAREDYFKDQCGTDFFDIEDYDFPLTMRPACRIHDEGFGRLGSNFLAENLKLATNIYKINKDNPAKAAIKATKFFIGVESPAGGYAYLRAQYKAGKKEGKSRWEITKIIFKANY